MKRVKIVRCAVCGREFEATRANIVCCSPECSREHKNRLKKASKKRCKARQRQHEAASYTVTKRAEAVTMRTLAAARRKPHGCSAVRWRMELSRRRMAAAGLLDMLPDPDMLA
jgi:hypothetical protein